MSGTRWRDWRWRRRWSLRVRHYWPDWVWYYGVRLIVVEIAYVVLLYAGTQWPTVLVAMVAVGIAWHFGRQQAELQRMFNAFAYMPVLTGKLTEDAKVIEIHNVGNGPAMDVRAGVLTVQHFRSVPSPVYIAAAVECTANHLAPRDACLARVIDTGFGFTAHNQEGRETPPVGSFDVWIIHCADLMGAHSHLVSDSTGEWGPPQYNSDGEWRWWYGKQSPDWVSQHCIRCRNLARWAARGEEGVPDGVKAEGKR